MVTLHNATEVRNSRLNPTASAIPLELLSRDQWVGYRNKRPVNPHTGHLADTTDPATWSSFTAACEAQQQYRLDGIGFVFSEDDPFVGIDLDKCVDPITGIVKPWALEIVERFASYTEFSPSGTGLHLIVRGSLPGEAKGRKRNGIEVYDHARFFTITGNPLPGTSPAITRNRLALTALYDQLAPPEVVAAPRPAVALTMDDHAVLDLARRAANGAKFSRLESGDSSDYAGDASDADLAFMSLLTFYTQDEAQLDRIFRQSGRYREKWERADYRAKTIEKALQRTTFYEPKQMGSVASSGMGTTVPSSTVVEPEGHTPSAPDGCVVELARIAELEQRVAHLEDENRRLQSHLTQTAGVLQNPHLTAGEKLTLIAVTFRAGQKASDAGADNPDHDGWVTIKLADDVAKQATCSAATASRHIEKACSWGLLEKRVTSVWKPERINPSTGEILPAGYVSEMHIRLPKPAEDVLKDMAVIAPERPQTWGGKRDKRPLTCPDHPDAAIRVKRHAFCNECDQPLGQIPDQLIYPNGAVDVDETEILIPTGNCILQSTSDDIPVEPSPVPPSTPTSVDVGTNDEHLAIPYADAKNDGLVCNVCRTASLWQPESIARGTCTSCNTSTRHDHAVSIAAGGAD